MQAWAEGVVDNYAWLTEELEFELGDATAGRPEFPGMPGGESIKTYYVDGICGMSSLWIPLFDKADELGVRSSTTPAPSSSSTLRDQRGVRRAHGGRAHVQGPQGRGHGVRRVRGAIPKCCRTTWPAWDARTRSPSGRPTTWATA